MLNCDQRDRFVNLYQILILAHPLVPTLDLNQIYHEIFSIHVSHFGVLKNMLVNFFSDPWVYQFFLIQVKSN